MNPELSDNAEQPHVMLVNTLMSCCRYPQVEFPVSLCPRAHVGTWADRCQQEYSVAGRCIRLTDAECGSDSQLPRERRGHAMGHYLAKPQAPIQLLFRLYMHVVLLPSQVFLDRK